MKDTPLVSVIMPAYNSAPFIEEAITSVINQSYDNWELLVIDDASTDGTVLIINSQAARDPRIILLKNPINKGPGYSRNLGIENAKGTFIAFLDADDMWLPHKLEIQIDFMREHNLEMTFSSYYLQKENQDKPFAIVEALPILTYRKLLKSNYVGNLTGIYDVSKTGKVFAPVMRKRQDWALWLTILKNIGKTRAVTQPLAIYRVRQESLSQNKSSLINYNFSIYRDYLKFGFFKSLVLMSKFLWEHFFVKSWQVKKLDKGGELL